MALNINRFAQRPHGRVIASAPLPSVSAHTASMNAQAARVPRLANINVARNAIGHAPATRKR